MRRFPLVLGFLILARYACAEGGAGLAPEDPRPPEAYPRGSAGQKAFVCYVRLDNALARTDASCRGSASAECARRGSDCRWIATRGTCVSRQSWTCQSRVRSLCSDELHVVTRIPATASEQNRKYDCREGAVEPSLVALPRGQ